MDSGKTRKLKTMGQRRCTQKRHEKRKCKLTEFTGPCTPCFICASISMFDSDVRSSLR